MFIVKNRLYQHGFTLLEILIALFIFTLISLMLMGALHNIITLQSGTEKSAERLRQLQVALLMMSRDIEQAVNRPILNTAGKEELSFIGEPERFVFTHQGFANATNTISQSTLQRTQYDWHEKTIWRRAWAVLDQAASSQPMARQLLKEVINAKFRYLDQEGRPHDNWPVEGQNLQPLPKAVQVYLSIAAWGEIQQLYVIPVSTTNVTPPPAAKS